VTGQNGSRTRLATPARPRWVKGRFDGSVTRSPGLPADGGSPEADVSDKPRLVRSGSLAPAEEQAILGLTRQRAEALHVLDIEVARIIGTLAKTGVLDETVVMFTSDNGYFLGEHRLRFAKTLLYEPSLRVPLLVAGPGVPVGERFDPVKTPDLTATILDLARARSPHPADGSSLMASIRHGDQGWTSPVLIEALVKSAGDKDLARLRQLGFTDARTVIGVRTARYKLVRWATGEVELYDLHRDPNELVNRATEPRYRDVRRDLEHVWWQFKDCGGTACSKPLPAGLQVEPERLAALTSVQAAGVRAMFGISWWP
jgi:N-acetylglucosamine-6-sulfatase